MISISEKSSVEIFLRNGFLNSAHFSTIGPTLKPFGLERVNKTPLALGLMCLNLFYDIITIEINLENVY